ncbi:hypothetical protein [Sciscionella sediminilitoris]|uniref:hypothetical protein n=1 Tax=Sciscionella sediminilitoris TaxID=1445613 RepID=UPI003CCDFA6F
MTHCASIDDGRFDVTASLYTDATRWISDGKTLHGTEAITAFLTEAPGPALLFVQWARVPCLRAQQATRRGCATAYSSLFATVSSSCISSLKVSSGISPVCTGSFDSRAVYSQNRFSSPRR